MVQDLPEAGIIAVEVVVSGVVDGWGASRRRAALLAGTAAGLAGVPAALSLGYLSFIDKLVGEAPLAASWRPSNLPAVVRAAT